MAIIAQITFELANLNQDKNPMFDVEKILKDTENARKRIINGEKILIILYDVWEELNLDELCIPFGINHTNCKILLASRSKDVCEKMNAQSKISVNSLPLEEAWILFKHIVGDKLETDTHLSSVAYDIAKECGGLPLVIDVIGKTLKNKDVNEWKATLSQLQKNALKNKDVDATIETVYNRLKLSYDYLKNEAQWCFLQCSVFPEDYNILVEDLVLYRVGLEKSKEVESIEEIRSTVQNAVNILKSCGLLLDINSKFYIRMHDVCCDMALLIANEGSTNHFLAMAREGLTEWSPRNNIQQSYTGISLMHNRIRKLPKYHISFPHLEAVYLQQNVLPSISTEFIEGIKNARVLDLAYNEISSLPQSLARLSQLRMLNLEGNRSICEITTIGELKGLEILILNSIDIEEVPECIGQLVNLRRLEVVDCERLSYIPPDVISKLGRLEELSIHFKNHCKEVHECLAAVNCLSKLTCLELLVPILYEFSEGFNFNKLKGFAIRFIYTGLHHLDANYTTWIAMDLHLTFQHICNSERYLALNMEDNVFPILQIQKVIESVYIFRSFLFDIRSLLMEHKKQSQNTVNSYDHSDSKNELYSDSDDENFLKDLDVYLKQLNNRNTQYCSQSKESLSDKIWTLEGQNKKLQQENDQLNSTFF
ncbi:disease resistance protein At4g27190-like [Rutidosis leptorrhynchoides]|uniref:disease resistance protein At4g27190-like n=1 Tax=Rutidosis leptorrhynchoides TaxID=125765 RepID=UPI003A993DDE